MLCTLIHSLNLSDISYNYAPAAAFFDEDDVPEDDHFEEEVCEISP